jgi:hypothetical protein
LKFSSQNSKHLFEYSKIQNFVNILFGNAKIYQSFFDILEKILGKKLKTILGNILNFPFRFVNFLNPGAFFLLISFYLQKWFETLLPSEIYNIINQVLDFLHLGFKTIEEALFMALLVHLLSCILPSLPIIIPFWLLLPTSQFLTFLCLILERRFECLLS